MELPTYSRRPSSVVSKSQQRCVLQPMRCVSNSFFFFSLCFCCLCFALLGVGLGGWCVVVGVRVGGCGGLAEVLC